MDRPDFVKEEHLTYLDNLRESGVTNMFGAGKYIENSFPELSRQQAKMVLMYWMQTFGKRR